MDAFSQQAFKHDGAPRSLLKRGAVTVSFDPTEVFWNGEPVRLSPLEAALLVALLRHSRLRWTQVAEVLIDAGGAVVSREVLIHRIRRKFRDVGADDPIKTLRGWGLRFRSQADRHGSHSIWIGVKEQDES
jgi:DNA-binding response OmpR family regulator